MARSKLTNPKNDLVSDSGAVLWSLVKGEQLEFPIDLDFLEEFPKNYTFTAVLVEAQNEQDQSSKPTTVNPTGESRVLAVRQPLYRGEWDELQAYNRGEMVQWNGLFFRLDRGVGLIDAIPPDVSDNWIESSAGLIFIQFPSDLIDAWQVQPTVGYPVYGFFELRVTEPDVLSFRKTWKPARGMVEVLFSPTYGVSATKRKTG